MAKPKHETSLMTFRIDANVRAILEEIAEAEEIYLSQVLNRELRKLFKDEIAANKDLKAKIRATTSTE